MKKPHIFIDVQGLAESLGRAASTIRKAVRELLQKGFLIWEGLVVQLKHKVYRLMFKTDPASPSQRALPVKEEAKPAAIEKAEEYKIPLSRKQEAGELIQCMGKMGVTNDAICQVMSLHKLEGTRRLILDFLEMKRAGKKLCAEEWFLRQRVLA